MDKLDQYRVFVQVAEMGSFINAAHALDLPRASVSAAVQQLESDLGTRLLHRTTRKVHATSDGLLLLERARAFLEEAEGIEQLFRASQQQVSGRLKVDVPSRVARRLIAPALPNLFRRYPNLQLALGSSDRTIDLAQEGVDCAVRIGTLPSSRLVVRPIGQLALINCASPKYLSEYGTPRDPQNLAQGHFAVGYASPSSGREAAWEYTMLGEELDMDIASRVIVNNAESYIACCCAGLGLIQIPRYDVQSLIDAGQLVEVMPEFRPASMPVSFVYPHRRQRSRRLSAFIEWFESLIQPHLES